MQYPTNDDIKARITGVADAKEAAKALASLPEALAAEDGRDYEPTLDDVATAVIDAEVARSPRATTRATKVRKLGAAAKDFALGLMAKAHLHK